MAFIGAGHELKQSAYLSRIVLRIRFPEPSGTSWQRGLCPRRPEEKEKGKGAVRGGGEREGGRAHEHALG